MFRETIRRVKEIKRLSDAERALFALSDRELADIGISRHEIPAAVRRNPIV